MNYPKNNVVLLEDREDIGAVTCRGLAREGFRVQQFSKVADFIYADPKPELDILLGDSFTLEKESRWVYDAVRVNNPKVRILLVSGGLDPLDPNAPRKRTVASELGLNHIWHRGREAFEDVSSGRFEEITLEDLVKRMAREVEQMHQQSSSGLDRQELKSNLLHSATIMGEVIEVDDHKVVIVFSDEGETEEREFYWSQLKAEKGSLALGDRVFGRTELEIQPCIRSEQALTSLAAIRENGIAFAKKMKVDVSRHVTRATQVAIETGFELCEQEIHEFPDPHDAQIFEKIREWTLSDFSLEPHVFAGISDQEFESWKKRNHIALVASDSPSAIIDIARRYACSRSQLPTSGARPNAENPSPSA